VGAGRRDRLFPDTASVSASIHQLYQNNCQEAEFIVLKGSVSRDFLGPFLACMDRSRSV
jgi:hypothetical protein